MGKLLSAPTSASGKKKRAQATPHAKEATKPRLDLQEARDEIIAYRNTVTL